MPGKNYDIFGLHMVNYFNFLDTQKLEGKLYSGEFPFSQYLFWDTAVEKIDIKKNTRYIVERVLTRGFLEDFYLLTRIYSKDEIVAALKKSKELDSKTVDFCSYYFDLPKSEMHVSSFYR
jgi:hypothetical protein